MAFLRHKKLQLNAYIRQKISCTWVFWDILMNIQQALNTCLLQCSMKDKAGKLKNNIREKKDFSYHVRPLVKGPARGGGTEFLKKGRLLLLLSKALQCWNASKWGAHRTMFSNKLQDGFPFALIKLGIATDKSPDWRLKRVFLENVQFGIPIVSITVIQYFLLKSFCDCKSRMF